MPTYSFECTKHGEFDRVMSMKEAVSKYPCPTCERDCNRVYKLHQVIQDDLGKDLVCTTLMGVDGDIRKSPIVRSRSELARVVAKHNEVHGTSLEPCGPGAFKARDWADE